MDHVFNCPHCDFSIIVNEKEINCGIFRHGEYKINHQQIPPHLPKDQCDKLISEDKIIGCGKPFKIIKLKPGEISVEICEYI
jgi:hypothetical protein